MKSIVEQSLSFGAEFNKSKYGVEYLLLGLRGYKPKYLAGYEKTNNEPDKFNDSIIVVRSDGTTLYRATATTDPGKYYTYYPMHSEGVANVVANTFFKDLWAFGQHQGYPALVQVGNITVSRDNDKDFGLYGDRLDTGNNFGINLHHGNDSPTIGRYSAGCQVVQTKAKLVELLKLLRTLAPASGKFGYLILDKI